MPSEKKLKANRANAKASTGPKTKAGKKASSRNALKLGLAIDIATDERFTREIDELAKLICQTYPSAHWASFRQIAAAELDLARIRKFRAQLSVDFFKLGTGGEDLAALGVRAAQLDRYEKRAYSRRCTAIKNLRI